MVNNSTKGEGLWRGYLSSLIAGSPSLSRGIGRLWKAVHNVKDVTVIHMKYGGQIYVLGE